jgi:hypothetical protein
MRSIPDRWSHNKFCKNRPCTKAYDDYVYSRDLSFGLPFHLKEKKSSNFCCDFCGIVDETVIHLPFKDLQHFTFCRNSFCYKQYLKFMQANPSIDSFTSKIPFILRDEVSSKLMTMKDNLLHTNNELLYKRNAFKKEQ